MSTTGRTESDALVPSDVADSLRSADFVRLIGTATGDGLAATAQLAKALAAIGMPYQASVVQLGADAPTAPENTGTSEADLSIAVGRQTGDADVALDPSAALNRQAYEIARAVDAGDAPLALAGMVAGGSVPQGTPLDDATSAGIERRPGIAIPTADVADGLAHSTLVHGPFSGSLERADEHLADLDLPEDLDEDAHRKIASVVALDVAGDGACTDRGMERVERFLRPYVGGSVETVGGYADVLTALAGSKPGLGLSFALGHGEEEAVLSAWREHGRRTHEAIREATTSRYDGLYVARCAHDVPLASVARLVGDFRSLEPVVLVVGDGEAVARASDETDVGRAMADAVSRIDGTAVGTESQARASFAVDADDFITAFREAR